MTAGFEPAGGGFAEYVRVMPWIVSGGGVAFVPDSATLEAASFLEPVNTCSGCVRVARLKPKNAVLVVGAGAIGLILARLCVLAGANVFVSEPMEERRERATKSGAKGVADPRVTDIAAWLRDATAGRGADAAIVAVPGQAPLDAALSGVRPGGKVVLFAHTKLDDPLTVDAGQICYLEKDVVGAYSADADLNDEVAELVFSGRLQVDGPRHAPLRSGRRGEGVRSREAAGAGSLKVLVTTGAGGREVTATMRAAMLRGREDVEIVDVPRPSPGPGEVVLRIEAALTCGTDAKVFRRGYHARMLTPPCLFGHEYTGIVADVGAGVTDFRAGRSGRRREQRRPAARASSASADASRCATTSSSSTGRSPSSSCCRSASCGATCITGSPHSRRSSPRRRSPSRAC